MPIRLKSPPRSLDLETSTLPVQREKTHDFSARSTAGRLLICTLVIGISTLIYSWSTLWIVPQSFFFNPDKAYEYRYSDHRLQETRPYIAAANVSSDGSLASPVSGNSPVICAAMVTVKRKTVQYVSDSVSTMLSGLTPEERNAIDARLLFANIDATVHPNWNETWLDVLDWWGAYNITDGETAMLRKYKAEKHVYAKGLFDYTYMLEQCLNETTAPYIALLEDDIVFADGWVAKTLDALATIRQKPEPWLYLRLFFTEWQLGWDKDVDSMATNPVLWFVLPTVFSVVLALAFKVRCYHIKRDINHAHCTWTWVMLGITIPTILTLIFLIRPDGFRPTKGVVEMNTKGCCAQALVYPRNQVPALIDHIREVARGPTDLVIEKYANKAELARYAIVPQLVQHVGLISTRGMPKKWTQQTWAFGFEGQKAEQLKLEHKQLARWGIWRAQSDDDTLLS